LCKNTALAIVFILLTNLVKCPPIQLLFHSIPRVFDFQRLTNTLVAEQQQQQQHAEAATSPTCANRNIEAHVSDIQVLTNVFNIPHVADSTGCIPTASFTAIKKGKVVGGNGKKLI